MATFIATYDLKQTNPDPHWEFLSQSANFNWLPWIKSSSGPWYRLPNTTLVGEFANLAAAVQALENTRTATQAAIGTAVIMEKWIVAERGASQFSSDQTQA